MAKLRKETQAYKNKLEYIKAYNKMMPKLTLQFNPKTEMDIIEWLNDKTKATYIKELIREDIKRNGGLNYED